MFSPLESESLPEGDVHIRLSNLLDPYFEGMNMPFTHRSLYRSIVKNIFLSSEMTQKEISFHVPLEEDTDIQEFLGKNCTGYEPYNYVVEITPDHRYQIINIVYTQKEYFFEDKLRRKVNLGTEQVRNRLLAGFRNYEINIWNTAEVSNLRNFSQVITGTNNVISWTRKVLNGRANCLEGTIFTLAISQTSLYRNMYKDIRPIMHVDDDGEHYGYVYYKDNHLIVNPAGEFEYGLNDIRFLSDPKECQFIYKFLGAVISANHYKEQALRMKKIVREKALELKNRQRRFSRNIGIEF